MNKILRHSAFLLLFFLVTINSGTSQKGFKNSDQWATAPFSAFCEEVKISPWKRGALTGVSVSFDDDCWSHNEISRILDQYGFKGSFFVFTKNILVDSLKEMVLRDHEIGNHTFTHADLTILDSLEIVDEIYKGKASIEEALGIKCVSFSSTFHSTNELIQQIGFDHHLFIRNGSEYPTIRRTRVDLIGSVTTIDRITTPLHENIRNGKMLLITGHGIDGDGWDPITSDLLRQVLDTIKTYSDRGDIWVSRVKDLAQYENMVQEIHLEKEYLGDTLLITLHGYELEKYRDMDESPLSIEFVKSSSDSIVYLAENLHITPNAHKDIVTIDLKKSNTIKAFVYKPVYSKTIQAVQKTITLFPNPAFDFVNISSTTPTIQAAVYNLAGQLMLLETGPVQQLDISGLKSGWYVVEVTTPNTTFTKKIRKVRR